MSYRRALLVAEGAVAPPAQIATLRRVAPKLERLLVVAELPAPPSRWLLGERAPEVDAEAAKAIEALRAGASGLAPSVEVTIAPELGADALAALCDAEAIDLLVFGARTLRSAWWASSERHHLRTAVLWADGPVDGGPIRELLCVALDARARGALGAFLRDHADRSMHATLLSATALAPDLAAADVALSGIEARVDVSSLSEASSKHDWLDEWLRERPVDLLVFSELTTAFLVSSMRAAPVLLVPAPSPAPLFGQRSIDAPDPTVDGDVVRVRVDLVATVGAHTPIPDQEIVFVAAGRAIATRTTRDGEAELPRALASGTLGLYRARETTPDEPLAAVEESVTVLAPTQRPLVVVDAALGDGALSVLAELTAPALADVLAVRLRPTVTCRSVRERLRGAGLAPYVVDARLVLDEGDAFDVSEALDAVRLARVARRLSRAGFPIASVVHRGPLRPAFGSFDVVSEAELEGGASLSLVATAEEAPPAATSGNGIELEVDNATARRWLFEAIARSERTLHVQVYMATDDDVGAPVEAALAEAAARGVSVKVLIDSLHGLHGSFGARNSLLERLGARPGVEVHAQSPITELPSLIDLKLRDHRKVVIVDGRLALVGGRNLAHEYYTGFDEVALTAASSWRTVPWLDGGARVEGPAVEALEASFLRAWTEAGGAPFPVVRPAKAGSATARVLVHRGLRDATTLEAYRALIDSARSHVYAVHGFPLVLELQRALLRALARGVRVRALIGCTAPTHGGEPFDGPWASARITATELVHSRWDPIAMAGGEVFVLARANEPLWAPDLGVVHPHVHAKVMSVDGERCTVGSANMDVTASYWESELLLLVEEGSLAASLERRIDALIASSTPVDREDAAYQALAQRRAWMRHWPGVLSV